MTGAFKYLKTLLYGKLRRIRRANRQRYREGNFHSLAREILSNRQTCKKVGATL